VPCLLASSPGFAASVPGSSADELLDSATIVLKQIDSGHYAAVWDSTAPFVKARIPEGEFVTTTRRARGSLGGIDHRGWGSVTRIQYANAAHIPDGLYANVDFSTTLVNGRVVYELLSFKLETDGRWHLTGYVPRQSQDMKTLASPATKP
jgi:hypothetical protein